MPPRQPVKQTRNKRAAFIQRGRIRLIGGTFRRRILPVIDSPGLRPTPDRVRETLFNWLTRDITGAYVLDLFSGTGALGLEALSRGARHVHLIEQQPQVANALRTNIAMLAATQQSTVHAQDAVQWLKRPALQPFDVVFLDPPFCKGLAAPCCAMLEENGWLAPSAFVYLEAEVDFTFIPPANWQLYRETHAGDSHAMLFLRHANVNA